MSMQCKNCGKDNPTSARFCGNCGAAQTVNGKPTIGLTTQPVFPALTIRDRASFWLRFRAAFLDGIIVTAGFMLLVFLVDSAKHNDVPQSSLAPLSLLAFSLPWFYCWLFTGLNHGRTPGKIWAGIKVVNANGKPPGLGSAALREILGKTLSAIVLFLGFIAISWDIQQKGWHDRIAGTYVIRAKTKNKEE
jgi:uncharacterized RDD family membrane protein YckC